VYQALINNQGKKPSCTGVFSSVHGDTPLKMLNYITYANGSMNPELSPYALCGEQSSAILCYSGFLTTGETKTISVRQPAETKVSVAL
jgi:hypothetical protein